MGRHSEQRILCAAVAALAAPGTAQAQTQQAQPAETMIDDIVVTARKQAENLQRTPLAISALSGADIAAKSATGLNDVANATPNVSFNAASEPGGGSSAQVFIRGVGQQDYLITSDPGVGIYADGVYLGRTTAGLLSLNDIERVEILRGPQGDLFGRNTIGGAINVISRKPTLDRVAGFAELGVGSSSRLDYSGALNLPIGPSVALRLSTHGIKRDGYGRSTRTAIDYGNDNNHAVRGQLLFKPHERLEMLIAADYYIQRQNGAPASFSGARASFDAGQGLYNNIVRPFLDPSLPLLSTAQVASDPRVSSSTGPSKNDSTVWGISATTTWRGLGFADAKFITAYRRLSYRIVNDNDGIANEISAIDDSARQWQVSQEVQLLGKTGRLSWVVGAFYFHESAGADTYNTIFRGRYAALEASPVRANGVPCAVNIPVPGCAGNPINRSLDIELYTRQDIRTDSYGAFGQFNYEMTNRLRATLGLRYSRDDKRYFTYTNRVASRSVAIAPTTLGKGWGSFTPRFGIDYKATNDLFVYAAASRGFKSGTFNGRASGQSGVSVVDPEYIWTYEAGFKSDMFNRRLRFNLTGFYSDYRDIQLLFVDSSNQQQAVNAGRAKIMGVEVELSAKPVRGVSLGASFGYTDAKLQDVPTTIAALANSFRDGMRLAKTPEFTLAAFGQVETPVGDAATLTARVDYSHRSSFFQRPVNETIALEPAYDLVDARITLRGRDVPVSLSVYATNLGDTRYNQAIIVGGTGAATSYPARGREVGVSARYEF